MIDQIKKIDGYADMTALEIASALNANPLHHRDAAITGGPSNTASVNLLHLLTARFKVMRQNKSQEWVGPLVDVAESNAEVGFALGMLYPHLQVKDSMAFCSTSTEAAAMVNGIVATIGGILEASQTGTTQNVIDAVAVLTGGRKFGSVTAEQVQTELDAEAKQAIRTATTGTVQAQIDPLQSKLNAIDSWLATDEALAMSVADYQAYADSLLATDDGNPSGGE